MDIKHQPRVRLRDFSVLAYAQGFTLWHYKLHADTVAEAMTPGYFDTAKDMLTPGDMVMMSGSGGTTVAVAYVADGRVTMGRLT